MSEVDTGHLMSTAGSLGISTICGMSQPPRIDVDLMNMTVSAHRVTPAQHRRNSRVHEFSTRRKRAVS